MCSDIPVEQAGHPTHTPRQERAGAKVTKGSELRNAGILDTKTPSSELFLLGDSHEPRRGPGDSQLLPRPRRVGTGLRHSY